MNDYPDDLEHVGGCGLLLQGLPQLVQQPGVLDGDDGLAREAREHSDLLVGEWPNLPTIDGNQSDRVVLFVASALRPMS